MSVDVARILSALLTIAVIIIGTLALCSLVAWIIGLFED